MQIDSLPSPWVDFFAAIDSAVSQPLELHCMGGFAATACYGLPRPTNDVDYVAVRPKEVQAELQRLACAGSSLAQKYGVCVHCVAVTTYPENYDQRLIEVCPGRFHKLRILVFEAYDLVLSKLERNSPKDRDDVRHLATTQGLKPEILRERYKTELRPYFVNESRHDATLQFWIEDCFEAQVATSPASNTGS
jgi:hypothetical protein